MKRRELLKKGALAAGATLTACGGGDASGPAVHTRDRISWRLVSSFPRGLDTIYGTCELLGERVAAMTEGRFRIRAYPAGEIVPGLQVLDAVQQGTVPIGQSASYYFTGKSRALAFDTGFPFGLTSRQQTAWLEEGGGRALVDQLFAPFDVVTLPAGNTGAQMGGWFRRPVDSVRDLHGLKMRIPGLGGEVMSRLGVTVQVLAGGDIYPALERGAIDATEWVGPYDDLKLGFHRIASRYYYPGWWEPGPSLTYYVHRAAWEGLPAVYREVLRAAARESARAMQARYDVGNSQALDELRGHGVTLQRFPADVMAAARRASAELLEESAAADPAFARALAPWKAFRERVHRWFGAAELAYAESEFPRPA